MKNRSNNRQERGVSIIELALCLFVVAILITAGGLVFSKLSAMSAERSVISGWQSISLRGLQGSDDGGIQAMADDQALEEALRGYYQINTYSGGAKAVVHVYRLTPSSTCPPLNPVTVAHIGCESDPTVCGDTFASYNSAMRADVEAQGLAMGESCIEQIWYCVAWETGFACKGGTFGPPVPTVPPASCCGC